MQDILRQQGFTFSVSSGVHDVSIIRILYFHFLIFQNVNIVAEIAVLLQTLAEHLSVKNLSITRKAIQV